MIDRTSLRSEKKETSNSQYIEHTNDDVMNIEQFSLFSFGFRSQTIDDKSCLDNISTSEGNL